MLFAARPQLSRAPVTVGISVYVMALGLATSVIGLGLHRVSHLVLQQFDLDAGSRALHPPSVAKSVQATAEDSAAPMTILRREGTMTPLQERWWDGASRPRYLGSSSPQFGSSSRNASRWGLFDRDYDDDEGDERPYSGGAYRTVCVRLCDGYYFPISFSVSRDRFARDAETCASRCGTQGRLFIQRSPESSAEDMEDLAGRPYRQLRTTFLYRTEYLDSCKCQPHPWEKAARDRHRLYALAAAARGGDRQALKEMRSLQTAMEQAARGNQAAPPLAADARTEAETAESRKSAQRADPDGERVMRLGSDERTPVRPRASPAPELRRQEPEADWRKKAFQLGY